MAFTTRMVSGYNRGGVTIHAPLGDGNLKKPLDKAHLVVTIHAPLGDGNKMIDLVIKKGAELQSTPR